MCSADHWILRVPLASISNYIRENIDTTCQMFGHTLIQCFFFIFVTLYIVESNIRHKNNEGIHKEICHKHSAEQFLIVLPLLCGPTHPYLCWV